MSNLSQRSAIGARFEGIRKRIVTRKPTTEPDERATLARVARKVAKVVEELDVAAALAMDTLVAAVAKVVARANLEKVPRDLITRDLSQRLMSRATRETPITLGAMCVAPMSTELTSVLKDLWLILTRRLIGKVVP